VTRIFISFSSTDERVAVDVADLLAEFGYPDVFVSNHPRRGITPGLEWEQVLYNELGRSDVVLFLQSKASAASAWCNRELGIARTTGLRLLILPLSKDVAFDDFPSVNCLPFASTRRGQVVAVAAALNDNGFHRSRAPLRDPMTSPFPGLGPFDESRAGLLVGRDNDISRLTRAPDAVQQLGRGGVMVITGVSGVGKSSVARAGVLPRLAAQETWLGLPPLVCSADVRADLSWLCRALRCNEVGSEAGLAALSAAVGEALRRQVGESSRRPVLLIDQAERLTLVPSQLATSATDRPLSDSSSLLRWLSPAISDPSIALWIIVVATPSERLDTLLSQELPGIPIIRETLAPMTPGSLPSTLDELGRRAAAPLDRELLLALCDDAERLGSLPLAGYALERMWIAKHVALKGRRDAPHNLGLADYNSLGGLIGIVTAEAEEALKLTDETIALGALERLVAIDFDDKPITVPQPASSFSDQELTALAPFFEKRLLVRSGDGTEAIGVAHDSLVKHWRRLSDLVGERRQMLVLRRDVRAQSARWHALPEAQRSVDGVPLVGDQLDRAATMSWTASEVEYISASIARHDREQRAERTARFLAPVAALAALALIAVVVFVRQAGTLRANRNTIQSLELAARAQRDVTVDQRVAATEALAAMQTKSSLATYGALFDVMTSTTSTRDELLGPGQGRASLAITSDDRVVVAGEAGITWLGDRNGGTSTDLRSLVAARGPVVVAAREASGELEVRDLTGTLVYARPGVGRTVTALALSPDASKIAIGFVDHGIDLIDVPSGEVHHASLINTPQSLGFSLSGEWLAASDTTRNVAILRTASFEHGATALTTSVPGVLDVAFLDDETIVASGQSNVLGLARLDQRAIPRGDIDLPTKVASLTVASGRIVAGLEDGRIAIVDPASGSIELRTLQQRQPIAALVANGPTLTALTADGRVLRTTLDRPLPPAVHLIDREIGLRAVASGADALTYVRTDRQTLVIRRNEAVAEIPLPEPPAALAIDPSGESVLIGGSSGNVWSLKSPDQKFQLVAKLDSSVSALAARGSSGSLAATVHGDLFVLPSANPVGHLPSAVVGFYPDPVDGRLMWMGAMGELGEWRDGVASKVGAISEPTLAVLLSPTLGLVVGNNEGTVIRLGVDGADGNGVAWLTPGHTDKIAGIGLAVGPAGDLLASASEDETVRLTDVTSGTPIGLPAQLVGRGEFTWAAGSTRGDFLTLGLDGRLLRWTVSQSALIDLACSIRTTVADQATNNLASKLCKTG
jgi:hypothetical protein